MMIKKLKRYARKALARNAVKTPLENAFELATSLDLFDVDWYQERYGSFATPLAAFGDYVEKSPFSNINPSANFDTESYLRSNLELYHSGEPPLLHHLIHDLEQEIEPPLAHIRWHPKSSLVAQDNDEWKQQKIAICLHIFYADFVEKFIPCLINLPLDVDVFVAVANDEIKERVLLTYSAISNVKQLKVVVAPNQGRNFGPLLVEFGQELLDYDLMCHMHSKKSLYSGREQTQWFDYLNQFLLKDIHVVSCLLRIFHQNPELGIYYPTSFWMMPAWVNNWTCNKPFAKGFVKDWDLDITKNFVNYPVGGMFWARPEALKQLLKKKYVYSDFPEEPLPNDGSWLHALERTLGLLVEKNDYKQFYYNPPTAKFTTDSSYIFANYHKSPEQLFDEVRRFDLVSFDIFDTVLRREFTEPDYAKLKTGQVLAERNIVATAEAFVLLRNTVEAELRQEQNFKGDVNIIDIYKRLVRQLDCDNDEENSLMQLEFDFDLEQVKAKDEMVDLVYRLADNGCEIWFITDIYYTQKQVETMLRKIGINLRYRLFVSSELKLRKDSGTMWGFIKNKVNEQQLRHIHIGDNVRSDAQICGDFGLSNMHVLHPIDKWQAIGFESKLGNDIHMDEKQILKWGKLISNSGRYPLLGE